MRLKSADNAHDVGFLHDQQVNAVELDFGARPLAEQNAVANFNVQSNQSALVIACAWANSDDFAFSWLFLGGVRNDNAALGLSSDSTRLTTTRSCSGRKLVLAIV